MLKAIEEPIDSGDTPVMRTARFVNGEWLDGKAKFLTLLPMNLICESFGDIKAACLLVPFRMG
jgi:hypothetical protein